MSGFVALLAPPDLLDSPLVERLADALAFRGPDGRGTCRLPEVAMAHAQLATREKGFIAGGRETVGPHSLDGEVWLVADARLDDRRSLALALNRPDLADAEDAALLLHAWRRWGGDCPRHLVGDFAFALWDGGCLFAARDPFGVKPCYWTHRGSLLAVGNTLETLRRLPGVSSTLCEEAVADFLVWGSNQDLATTAIRDIRRLPPGHQMMVRPGEAPRIEPFWQWPEAEGSMERGKALVSRYRAVLEQAVEDRLTGPWATVFLSGGMDSTSVAALTSHTLVRKGLATSGVLTQTAVYRRLFDDPEGAVAGRVAAALGLANEQRISDDDLLFEGWRQRRPAGDLYDGSMLPLLGELYRRAAARGRIAMTGDGSDPAFFHPADQLWRLLARGRLDLALAYLVGHGWRRGRLPPLGFRTLLDRWRGTPEPDLPSWLAPSLGQRLRLVERYRALGEARRRRFAGHPHAEACRSLSDPQWVSHFESLDPGATGLAVETRYPFFDRRLIELTLGLPMAWCLDKRLLRRAMDDHLPAEILDRPKTPMVAHPHHDFAEPPVELLERVRVENPIILEYLDLAKLIEALERRPARSSAADRRGRALPRSEGTRRDALPGAREEAGAPHDPAAIRAIALAYWLAEVGG